MSHVAQIVALTLIKYGRAGEEGNADKDLKTILAACLKGQITRDQDIAEQMVNTVSKGKGKAEMVKLPDESAYKGGVTTKENSKRKEAVEQPVPPAERVDIAALLHRVEYLEAKVAANDDKTPRGSSYTVAGDAQVQLLLEREKDGMRAQGVDAEVALREMAAELAAVKEQLRLVTEATAEQKEHQERTDKESASRNAGPKSSRKKSGLGGKK